MNFLVVFTMMGINVGALCTAIAITFCLVKDNENENEIEY